jgi:hypothetical protein
MTFSMDSKKLNWYHELCRNHHDFWQDGPLTRVQFNLEKERHTHLDKRADDSDLAAAAYLDIEVIPGGHFESANEEAEEQATLERAAKIARYLTVFLTIALLILGPMPMYGSGYVFSKKFFTGWVSLFPPSFSVRRDEKLIS